MKLTKSQLKEIIREEMTSLNENFDLDKVADLYAYAGTNPSKWNDKIVQRYGQETIDIAKKLLPTFLTFEKKVGEMLYKIRNDKMYPIYLEMVEADNSYMGGRGFTSFNDVLNVIAYKNKLK
jgi:hypothetical protein